MSAIHRRLSEAGIRQLLWSPGNRPTDLVPRPKSSGLGLIIPRFFHLSLFLSAEFIIIGDLLTPWHGLCGCSPTRLLAAVRGCPFWAFSLLGVLFKKLAAYLTCPRMTT
jgi:hypothetical protein